MAQLQGSTLSSSQLFDTPCGSLRAIFMVIKASTTTKKTKPGESFHLYMCKENEYTKFKQKKKKGLFMGVALLAVAHLNGCKAHRTQSVAEERRRCVVRWAERNDVIVLNNFLFFIFIFFMFYKSCLICQIWSLEATNGQDFEI
jgi:hypothetical protein